MPCYQRDISSNRDEVEVEHSVSVIRSSTPSPRPSCPSLSLPVPSCPVLFLPAPSCPYFFLQPFLPACHVPVPLATACTAIQLGGG
jgi:hypothetical protein